MNIFWEKIIYFFEINCGVVNGNITDLYLLLCRYMKVDFKKTENYKAKHNKFQIIEIPTMQYLMVDGHGDPNTSEEFSQAIETLFPVAYKLKFMSKKELEKDYVVPPLEGLWWAKSMDDFTVTRDKSKWDWTLMLMTPDWITQEMFERVKEQLRAKDAPVFLDKIRLEKLDEGTCVQTLHIGSFDDEGPVLEKLHTEYILMHNLQPIHKHHEIYLSDFRKVSPEKLKTILRQPVTQK